MCTFQMAIYLKLLLGKAIKTYLVASVPVSGFRLTYRGELIDEVSVQVQCGKERGLEIVSLELYIVGPGT
jgi:hypothetical protein